MIRLELKILLLSVTMNRHDRSVAPASGLRHDERQVTVAVRVSGLPKMEVAAEVVSVVEADSVPAIAAGSATEMIVRIKGNTMSMTQLWYL